MTMVVDMSDIVEVCNLVGARMADWSQDRKDAFGRDMQVLFDTNRAVEMIGLVPIVSRHVLAVLEKHGITPCVPALR